MDELFKPLYIEQPPSPQLPVVPHKAVAEASKIGSL